MKGRYFKVKTSIFNWRENNKDAYNEYQRTLMMRKRVFNKIKMEYMAILLD